MDNSTHRVPLIPPCTLVVVVIDNSTNYQTLFQNLHLVPHYWHWRGAFYQVKYGLVPSLWYAALLFLNTTLYEAFRCSLAWKREMQSNLHVILLWEPLDFMLPIMLLPLPHGTTHFALSTTPPHVTYHIVTPWNISKRLRIYLLNMDLPQCQYGFSGHLYTINKLLNIFSKFPNEIMNGPTYYWQWTWIKLHIPSVCS